MMDASFGSDLIFEFFKCCRRAASRPFVLGSVVRFTGYLWWKLAGRKPLIAQEKVAFLKKEQTAKLRGSLWPFDVKRTKEAKQLYMGKE
jgi:biofilm PGA synthesis N-glycosyltransferase PgaC